MPVNPYRLMQAVDDEKRLWQSAKNLSGMDCAVSALRQWAFAKKYLEKLLDKVAKQ